MKMMAEWFWVDRWMGSSAFLLPMEARGVYREMLSQAWRRGGRLPADHDSIKRAIGASDEEWVRSWPKVEKFWRVDGDSLVNETQLAVYEESTGRKESKVRGGKARAAAAERTEGKFTPARQPAETPAHEPADRPASHQREHQPPSPSPSPSLTQTPNPGRVVKAEPTATEIAATKRFLGAPNGTPLKFEHETTKLLANGLTPKDLGFLLEPSQYAHQELAWAITRLVASRNLHGLPEKRKAAVELLHDASRTPAGLKIETLDLRRVSPAWVKITTDRLIEIAADVYGVSDGRLFGATA